MDGDRSQIAIDSAWGFGEGVVAGEVTPDNFLVDKVMLEILERTVVEKPVERHLAHGNRQCGVLKDLVRLERSVLALHGIASVGDSPLDVSQQIGRIERDRLDDLLRNDAGKKRSIAAHGPVVHAGGARAGDVPIIVFCHWRFLPGARF